jgi:hypothetical protein
VNALPRASLRFLAGPRRWRALLGPLALALLFTGLNAVKPLHIDDPAYYYYAAQIAREPLDPYGFEVFWQNQPRPALEVLAPPVLPYALAPAVWLFGERPVLWKLWLFPFVLVLVLSLRSLLGRFARGLETPLLWMTVLSPSFLPGLNLMLDVPALALGLGALALYCRAADRDLDRTPRSRALAALAGLVAGLAMETKYTALVIPMVILAHARVHGRQRLGLVAAGVAALCFGGCEALIAGYYGQSHFFFHLGKTESNLQTRINLALPLLGILGGVAPAVALVGMAALNVPSRKVLLTGAAVVLGFFLLALVPDAYATFASDAGGRSRLTLNSVFFGTVGLLTAGTLAAVAWRLNTLSALSPAGRGEPDSASRGKRASSWCGGWCWRWRVILP